jgi:hypothetical protein
MKTIITFGSLLILLSLQGCVFPKAGSSYVAKGMCSCLFVVGQTEKQCEEYTKTMFHFFTSYKVNLEEKFVTSSFLFMDTKASYTSERFGCKIDK